MLQRVLHLLIVGILLPPCLWSQSSPLPAYVILNKKGQAVDFNQMAQELSKADVILFGEQHNNPIDHWLELELTMRLWEIKSDRFVIGAEMFETDDQLVLNEYLNGTIKHQHLEKETKIWSNYQTDYRPIVEFAKEKGIAFIATNIPRRYANLVANRGTNELDSLSSEVKKLMTPLPLIVSPDDPGYKEIREMNIHSEMASENFIKAQAIKDATMAHFILSNWRKGITFLHFNGDFHSKDFSGIYGYLTKKNNSVNVMTISCVENAALTDLGKFSGRADFVICTPDRMTKTH